MTKRKTIYEFVRVEHFRVKKCCASCAFKVLTTRRYRGCRRHQRKVLPTMVCRDWMISNVFQLKNQQTTTKK